MEITNRAILLAFIKKHTDAIAPVNKWIELVENNKFTGHNELKAFFHYADYVGNGRYVFNIKGNRYRFLVLVVFVLGTMEIRFCGTHAEYDRIKNIENL